MATHDAQLDLFALQAPTAQERADSVPQFHVRDHMPVEQVQAGEVRVRNQNALVLEYFLARPGKRMTPFEVHQDLAGPQHRADGRERWPLTSTRRAITDLTKLGHLQKHLAKADSRMGGFGDPNHTWSLVEKENA